MKIRYPCQAGMFYANTEDKLTNEIINCFKHKLGPGRVPKTSEDGARKIVGLISPHAGLMYSGHVAAHSYFKVAEDGRANTVVIFGPNHSGYGSNFSIMREGFWRTPLGDVEIDSVVADKIISESDIVEVDESAHRFEHSIEVQLPFLQFIYGSNFRFVPLCFLKQDLQSSLEVGRIVAQALASENALIVASTDMTHYESQKEAEYKDKFALKAVEKMDERSFYSVVEGQHITACGYGPVVALMTSVKLLGAKTAKILSYQTSGEVTSEYSSVVGYASAVFSR